MAKQRVKLNLAGINQIMRSAPVQAEVNRRGAAMAQAAGEGFEYRPATHRWTARGYVQTADRAGAKKQADDAVLERVLGSGS